MLDLIRFLYREAAGPKLLIVALSLVSGVSRAAVLALINTAAAAISAVGTEALARHLTLFALAVSVYFYTSYFTADRTVSMTQRLTNRLRLELSRKVLTTQLRFVEEKRRPVLLSCVITDINLIASAVSTMLGAFQGGVLLLFSIVYIGWLSLAAMAATLVAIAAGVATHLFQARRIAHQQELARQKSIEFHQSLEGLVDGFKELKQNRRRREEYADALELVSAEHRDLIVSTNRINLKSDLTSQAYMFALIAAMLVVVPVFVQERTTLVFQFLTAILFLMAPLESVVTSIPAFTRAQVSWRNIRAIEADIDRALSEEPGHARPAHAPAGFDRIRLRGVGFSYPSDSGERVFEVGPIDLDIGRGELIFIAGGNGSGKTTLVKLLTGLYLPDSGAIEVDGRPLGIDTYQAYRELFTTVMSDFHLFNRLYGVEALDEQVVNAMLETLGLAGKTHVRDGRITSTNLSTGQRKRLAFVVSWLDRRPIHVFDEFAAEQDPQFRDYFYHELLPSLVRDGKTVIAVTHDDRYYHLADRVLRMDLGKLAV